MFNLILIRDDGVKFETGAHIEKYSFTGIKCEKIICAESEDNLFVRFPTEVFFVIYLREFGGNKSDNIIEFIHKFRGHSAILNFRISEKLSLVPKIKLFSGMYSTFDIYQKLSRHSFPVGFFESRMILLLSMFNSFEIRACGMKTSCSIGNGVVVIEHILRELESKFKNSDGKEIEGAKCTIENCKKLLFSNENKIISTFGNREYFSFVVKILSSQKMKN